MKKLLLLPLLALSFAASAQLEGVNDEHLPELPASLQSIVQPKDEWKAKRIALTTGVTLEYVEKGAKNGTPVIFLHGICDSWHSFEPVLNHLPSFIRAFAITQRGHGDSEKPLEGYTPKEFAADVAAFIQQKGLGSAIVVGHSMGGVHTQQFAISYPKLAKGIVVIDSDASFLDNPGMPEFYREVRKMEGEISW
jgi:non-heme chloroperoxidase